MTKFRIKKTGRRHTFERVKTARGRTKNSQRWLQRHINDVFVKEARQHGYRSRAAFKLLQLNERFQFIKPGLKVVDLGAAPGSWLQVLAPMIQVEKHPETLLIGVDLLEIEPIEGTILIQADFLDAHTHEILKDHLKGKADLILSDMAANTTGHAKTDHLRTLILAEEAVNFVLGHLNIGGSFITKLFQGGEEHELIKHLKTFFKVVKFAKPEASRQESAEKYVVALHFKGT